MKWKNLGRVESDMRRRHIIGSEPALCGIGNLESCVPGSEYRSLTSGNQRGYSRIVGACD